MCSKHSTRGSTFAALVNDGGRERVNYPMKIVLAAVVAAVALSGCGGGDDSSPASIGKAEGAYRGNTSGGQQFETIILDDDRFYSLYGTISGEMFFVAGLAQGNGTSDNGQFTSSNIRDFGVSPPQSGTLSATYVPATSISGTVTAAGSAATLTFAGSAIPSTEFDYSTPADLSLITGAWSLRNLDGSTTTLDIASSGAMTGASSGCAFNGTISPRASGKNVFDISLTFGAAPCAQPGQVATGIGLTFLVNGGPIRELVLAGTNSARSSAAVAVGRR